MVKDLQVEHPLVTIIFIVQIRSYYVFNVWNSVCHCHKIKMYIKIPVPNHSAPEYKFPHPPTPSLSAHNPVICPGRCYITCPIKSGKYEYYPRRTHFQKHHIEEPQHLKQFPYHHKR